MALSRVKVWSSNEILTAAALNAEFNNLLNNAAALISPLTGNLDLGSNAILNLDSLTFNDMLVSPVTTGQLQRNGALLQYYDGTRSHSLLSAQAPANFNYTFNGDFEIWGGGTLTVPTGWSVTGAGAAVSRAGGAKTGSYSLSVQRVGTDCYVYQDVHSIYGPIAWWQGKTVTLGCWGYATAANRVRLSVEDGVSSSASAYHSGGSTYEWLTVTHPINGAATLVRPRLHVNNGDMTALFDGATLVVGTSLADFIPSGWRGRKAIIPLGTGVTTVPAGSTWYASVAATSASESLTVTRVPFKGVARNLHMRSSSNPGGGQTYTYTVRKVSVDTALTATIVDPSGTAADVSNEVAFDKGNNLSMKIVTSAGAGVSTHNGMIEFEEIP
jgi:hypothetical protein